jgi:rhodanese-related sulfurtransferase
MARVAAGFLRREMGGGRLLTLSTRPVEITMADRANGARPRRGGDIQAGGSGDIQAGGRGYAGLAVLGVLLLALAVSACTGGNAQPPAGAASKAQVQEVSVQGAGSYRDVNVAGLVEMLQSKDFPLVNVHIPYEGEIENTDLFIPYNEITAHLDQLSADRDARIVLYCRSDNMSGMAARELVKLGYTDVWNLKGGFVAWKAEGHELLNRPR